MTDLVALTATELLDGYAAGRFSPVDATEAVIGQIERRESELGALYLFDAQKARAAARASEARWRAGEPLRLKNGTTIDGVPITIKENIATKGDPLPVGTVASDHTPQAADAPAAARVREAGAVILAKTTMPDYGMLSSGLSSFHQLARNPWNLAMNPGGSSAGAGAAGAAGYGPLHLGTDIGGSVRLPGSWCGLVGLKPSFGRVPVSPPFMARAVGPMTRTVADAGLLMNVIAQPDARDHMSLPPTSRDFRVDPLDLQGVRIGLLLDAGCGLATDPQVRRVVEEAARRLEEAGATIEPISPWMDEDLLNGVDRFWRARAAVDFAPLSDETRARILPAVREWGEAGADLSGAEVYRAYAATLDIRARTLAATQGFDFVLSPVSPNASFPAEWPHPANDVAQALAHIGFTLPFSIGEQPAVSVPFGRDDAGVPVGIQMSGRRFDDVGVLSLAAAIEAIRPEQPPFPF